MTALVTGGGGFLGGAIVVQLLHRGGRVRSFSRGDYPELQEMGVELVRGDLTDAKAIAAAVQGCDVVFHVAARPGIGGRYRDYYRPNVLGTRNILQACLRFGVRRLIYTSSPSVVFDGNDMEGVDESIPYPYHYEAHYPKTKSIAEQMVLAANGPDLSTVSLRPHLIWGPGDNHLIPRILARARAGTLRKIGKESKLIDAVYVDNAADAHLLAADRLAPGSKIAGRVYFISQGEPIPLWELINKILSAGGLPAVQRTISRRAAYLAGWVLELIYGIANLPGDPPMTRFLASELSTAHWFNLEAARRDLGYQPRISTEEGLKRLALWLRDFPQG